jgi:hypothetical protein
MRQGYLHREEKSRITGYYWKKYHVLLKDNKLFLYDKPGGKLKYTWLIEKRPVAEGYENFSRRPFTFKVHLKENNKGK